MYHHYTMLPWRQGLTFLNPLLSVVSLQHVQPTSVAMVIKVIAVYYNPKKIKDVTILHYVHVLYTEL